MTSPARPPAEPGRVPTWFRPDDPWLSARMRRVADIRRLERQLGPAVTKAMSAYLDTAHRAVLGTEPGAEGDTLTAAGRGQEPDLSRWPGTRLWLALIEFFVMPVIGVIFSVGWQDGLPPERPGRRTGRDEPDDTERGTRRVRGRVVTDDRQYQRAYLDKVPDRLSQWPDGVFEVIRTELQASSALGEDQRQRRARVGRVLNIDARSRALQAEIDLLTRTIEDPATSASVRREARARRSTAYRAKDRADRQWWPDAARIARTETTMALNGGTYTAAAANAAATQERRWTQWWATEDTRTRASHWDAHMQVREIGTPFEVGGSRLDHPGDPNGPAHEVINCRCSTLILHTEDEADQQRALYEQRTPPTVAATAAPIRQEHVMPETVAAAAEKTIPIRRGRWRTPLNRLGGSGRGIEFPMDHMLSTRQLPMALFWKRETPHGNDDTSGGVVVGRVDTANVVHEDGRDWITGALTFDMGNPDAVELVRQIDGNFQRWISVTLDHDPEAAEAAAEQLRRQAELNETADRRDPDDEWDDRVEDDPRLPVPEESVELDDDQDDDIAVRPHDRDRTVFWRLANLTVVGMPEFDEATIEVMAEDETENPWASPAEPTPDDRDPVDEQDAVVAAVTGDTSAAIADRDRVWDGTAAKRRLAAWARDDSGRINVERMSQGVLWRDPEGNDQALSTYKFPIADIVGGKLMIVRRGVLAAANALSGGRGGTDIPEPDQARMRSRLNTIYRRMREMWEDPTMTPPWESTTKAGTARRRPGETRSMIAAAERRQSWAHQVAEAAANLHEPPAEAFANPKLTRPTPLQITPDGRVFGHAHDWTTLHVGYEGRNVRALQCRENYRSFNLRPVRCADGSTVKVGALVKGGHASTGPGSSTFAAMQHYDDPAKRLARVRAGRDEFGTWIAGTLVPGITPEEVLSLAELSLSPDWREVSFADESGKFVGISCVNVPGLPIVEPDDEGEDLAMVAAGVIQRERPAWEQDDEQLLVATDLGAPIAQLGQALAASLSTMGTELGQALSTMGTELGQALSTFTQGIVPAAEVLSAGVTMSSAIAALAPAQSQAQEQDAAVATEEDPAATMQRLRAEVESSMRAALVCSATSSVRDALVASASAGIGTR